MPVQPHPTIASLASLVFLFGLLSVPSPSPHAAARKPVMKPAKKAVKPVRKPTRPAAKPAPPPAPSSATGSGAAFATGSVTLTQPLQGSGNAIRPVGLPRTQGISNVTWLRHSAHEGMNGPLFPGAPLVGGSLNAPLVLAGGEVKTEPARWLTAVSGSRALTAPVGAMESYPAVEITPQTSGGVVTLGQRLPLAVTLTNVSSTVRAWSVTYNAITASGSPFASGQFMMTVPAMSRVTTPLVTQAASFTGSVTVAVTAQAGGTVIGQATCGGGVVPPVKNVVSGEFPLGIAGGDLPLAQAAGVQYWMGEWPWWKAADFRPDYGARSDVAPGYPEATTSLGDQLGIAIVSRAYTGAPDAQLTYEREMMTHFKRRAGGWAFEWPQTLDPAAYASLLRRFHANSKAIHKDALTFMELPDASSDQLEMGRTAAKAGADTATDTLAVHGLGVTPDETTFASTLEHLSSMRNSAYPALDLWNVGERLPLTSATPVSQAGAVVRSTVRQLAGGVEKVFWQAEPSLLREDGTAAPGFFGVASLAAALGGAEYVGPMPWDASLRGEVFQKNGAAILVAWALTGTKTVTLPLAPGRAPEVRDPMYTRSNLQLSGNKLTLTTAPVYLLDLGKSLLNDAGVTGRNQRLKTMRAAMEAIGLPVKQPFPSAMTDAQGTDLLKAAMALYEPEAPRRADTLTAVYDLLKFWDLEALARAAADQTSGLAQANVALNAANRAQADYRIELDYREGTQGYHPEMRRLLTQVERRLYLARQALRQGDYALARAHAEEMSAAARVLAPLVKSIPIGAK